MREYTTAIHGSTLSTDEKFDIKIDVKYEIIMFEDGDQQIQILRVTDDNGFDIELSGEQGNELRSEIADYCYNEAVENEKHMKALAEQHCEAVAEERAGCTIPSENMGWVVKHSTRSVRPGETHLSTVIAENKHTNNWVTWKFNHDGGGFCHGHYFNPDCVYGDHGAPYDPDSFIKAAWADYHERKRS